jgi:Tfp pilus assembly protein PilZ
MMVTKAAATEVTNYYNCGNKVKVVVENVGLPDRYRWRTRSVWATIASTVTEESTVGHADSGERGPGKTPGHIENGS